MYMNSDNKKKISVVIPCYKSSKTITNVVGNITATLDKQEKYDYEIILINDGSPDETFKVIEALAQYNKKITALDLSKNFGQHSALMAGYSTVTGDYVLGMDDDGEHDPKQMFLLIDKIEEGYDYVCGKFEYRKDRNFIKKLGSKVNGLMGTYLLNKPKDLIFSSYYVMSSFLVKEIIKCKNPYSYIGGIILTVTDNMTSVKMEHRERLEGKSGYSLKKSLSLWLNGFTAFSVKPLRMASYLGVMTSIIGFVFSIVIILNKIFNPSVLIGYSSIMAILLITSGIIMLLLGMIGEYIGRIYMNINQQPQYVIKKIVKSK